MYLEDKAFCAMVVKVFAFLCKEYRFIIAASGNWHVVYKSPKACICIGFPSEQQIIVKAGRWRSSCNCNMMDLLDLAGWEANKYLFEAGSVKCLEEQMGKIAELMKEKLAGMLCGDTRIFRAVRKSKRDGLCFRDYYFQRLGFKKAYYVDRESGRKYTETGEFSIFRFFYTMGLILASAAAVALGANDFYILILAMGLVLYPFNYFFTTFEAYIEPEDEERYRYW